MHCRTLFYPYIHAPFLSVTSIYNSTITSKTFGYRFSDALCSTSNDTYFIL
ncbi:hypothetical protein M096_1264 [Parabacteroides distasonis str. 3999B T(B) 6]|nr:hypothetical protein M096_1264 [Parabacteroides distasonis str. 3999B T(B) 6]KDS71429.1 hypothetical protein M095_1331 [Parabacteroides distasonis str. 3999B T(B) 4]